MTDRKSSPEARAARLEAALKANLKRRKTQARARRAMADGGQAPGDQENSPSLPAFRPNPPGKTSD